MYPQHVKLYFAINTVITNSASPFKFCQVKFYHSQQQFKTSFLWEIDLADLKEFAELANLTV